MPRPRQLKAEWPPSWKSRGTWERKIESNPRFWNIVLLVFVCLFCYVVFFISARTFFIPCEPKSCLCEDTLISPRSIFTKISRHKREKKSEEWDLTTRPWICWNLDWKKRASETWGDFLFRPAPDSLSILRSERVQPKVLAVCQWPHGLKILKKLDGVNIMSILCQTPLTHNS